MEVGEPKRTCQQLGVSTPANFVSKNRKKILGILLTPFERYPILFDKKIENI